MAKILGYYNEKELNHGDTDSIQIFGKRKI
jgi:hypothetical protein